MNEFIVIADDAAQTIELPGEATVQLSAGEGVEVDRALTMAKKDPPILPPDLRPTKVAPTVRVTYDDAWRANESDLEQHGRGDTVVAEIPADGRISIEDLLPIRDQVHARGHDFVALLTRGGD